MVSTLRFIAIIVLAAELSAPAGTLSQGAATQEPQAASGADAQAVARRIDLVRQHYTSSRVAGALLELSGTLDLVRALLAAENVQPRARSRGELPRAGRDVPMPGLLKRSEPEYPIEAAKKGLTGHVAVDAVIDKSGRPPSTP